MRRGSDEHHDTMLRVAELYYEQQLTQEQIGQRLVLTRWKVGRLLVEARETGMVRIEIVHPRARRHREEARLVEAFGLDDAVVVPVQSDDVLRDPTQLRRQVARSAAAFLCDLTPRPQVLGVSWGRTLDDLAQAVPPGWTTGVEVVQVNGAVTRSRRVSSGVDVATELARQGRGTVSLLPAPAIVERATTRKALESDPAIRGVLDAARSADVLVFSLGALSSDSVLVEAGYLTRGDVDRLRASGAVGDVLGRFVDADGVEVDLALRDRTVGISLDDIRRAGTVVAVASGPEKAGVARAAVATGLCSVLVTDSEVAGILLADTERAS